MDCIGDRLRSSISSGHLMGFIIVSAAYVLCLGLTVFFVTPAQRQVLPEITVFASLIYLPHGVRVLATWAYGWKAIPALIAGSVIAAFVFFPDAKLEFLTPALFASVLYGAVTAYIAFELVRLIHRDYYFGNAQKPSWKGMIVIGAIASIINSIGQTLIFSGLIDLDKFVFILVTYAIGDLVGLILCMAALMIIFRWIRLNAKS